MPVDPALLAALPLIADGVPTPPPGPRGPGGGAPPEALNQEQPARVQAQHAAYAAAGARLLRTNTAGAQAARLAAHGLAERAEALNNAGSALARAAFAAGGGLAAGGGGLVMGTLEPPPAPGLVHTPEWRRAYGEQIIYLSDTAVDFFLLQHCTRLEDALALTGAIQRASDAPVLAGLLLDAAGRTADGHGAAAAAKALADAGAGALGLSCGPGPAALPACLEALLAPGLPVAVLAGLHVPGSDPPYPGAPTLEPAAFADWLAPLGAQGVAILGGCCGVTPAHIAALAGTAKRSHR
jgi:methionine synthase I (cobalamin-dependent)